MSFIQDITNRFQYYKDLGDKTLSQLNNDEAFHYRLSDESNSIEIIIKHMHGNMRSRFVNFLTEDGEKPWRMRDDEFEASHFTKEKLIQLWEEGWQTLFNTLSSLADEDLDKTIYIRTEPTKVYDALLRQLAHYPYHVGQIILIAKKLKDKNWQSLSIAKGESNKFNEMMKGKSM